MTNASKPTICIVDDDDSVRKALGRLVRAAGYKADAFESAEDFLAGGRMDLSSCLILDVHLPGMNGLELQTAMKSESQDLPIIFISAFSNPAARSSAIATGAIDFLPKPLDTDRLLTTIERAISK